MQALSSLSAATVPATFGAHLRQWRQRRHLSQLDLSHHAGISTRHLSFLETNRSSPSREMVLRLLERLEVPLRDRNALLTTAGFAPMYRERPLDHPEMASARAAVELILRCHEPYPALAMDRHWNLVAANRMVPVFLVGVDAALLQPPVNVLRLSLHPLGLASRIANLAQWKRHLFERLHTQIRATGDAVLQNMVDELRSFDKDHTPDKLELSGEALGVVMPFQFQTENGVLSFISTVTVFGSPVDITLQELALETFLPADSFTATVLRQLAPAADAESFRRNQDHSLA